MTIIFLSTLILMFAITTAFPFENPADTIAHTEDTPAFRWSLDNFPNPRTQPTECGGYRPSYVCDPENVLRYGEADRLDFLIGLIKNETSCFCSECNSETGGITIAIAITNSSVFRKFHHEAPEAVKNFAEGLRKSWRFGVCDDDIVILISVSDRQSYITSGETVTKAISTEQTDRIFVKTKGHFHNDHYYQGLESIIQSYYDVLRTIQHSPGVPQDEIQESSVGLAVGLVVGFIVLGGILGFVIVIVRRRRSNNSDKIHYDTAKTPKDQTQRPIVKKTVDFFPNTVYQPCSIDDNENSTQKDGGEIYHLGQARAQVYGKGNELSMVIEETERGEEEVSETSTQEATPEIEDKETNINEKENVKV